MTEEKQWGWGGKRPNQTGRPKGTTKAEGVRGQHQLRAYDDEWELIREFASLIKHGKKEACQEFLESMKEESKE